MSTYSDRRIEKAAAARKLGAPLGPRILPSVHFDDEGSYTVYHGKHCAAEGCGLLLTSRNRYGKELFCAEHGREFQRNRVRGPRAARSVSPRPEQCEERRMLHSLFSGWVRFPTEETRFGCLIAAMNNYELRCRIRRALPPLPPATPTAPTEPTTGDSLGEPFADPEFNGA